VSVRDEVEKLKGEGGHPFNLRLIAEMARAGNEIADVLSFQSQVLSAGDHSDDYNYDSILMTILTMTVYNTLFRNCSSIDDARGRMRHLQKIVDARFAAEQD
jgi:hypothetical protein